jgi:YVTN family beta-propeller protein
LGTSSQPESRSDAAVSRLSVGSVDLYPIPYDVEVACRRAQDGARVPILCPTHLPRPRTGLDYTALAPLPFLILPLRVRREVYGVDISYDFPTENPKTDGPERFLHFDIQAREGRFRNSELPPGVRPATLGGRRGLLAPASSRGYAPEPYFTNHVRFFWSEAGTKYAATLHNFGPGTRAVLDALVARLRPADQLDTEEPQLAAGVQRIPVPLDSPVSVATDDSAVWVAGSRALIGLDPDSHEPVSDVVEVPEFPPSLAADREVWVAHPASYVYDERDYDPRAKPHPRGNALQRLDPTGSRWAESIRAGPDPTGVALGHGSVWVTDLSRLSARRRVSPLGNWPGGPGYTGGAVQRIDPRRGRILARIPVGGAPAAIAVGEGGVWVTNNLDDTVTEIDPQTNRVMGETRVGDSPLGIATGFGATWVANSGDDTVSRIDPDVADGARTIAVGRGGPRGVAVGEGSVWVGNYLDDTVSRIDPTTNEVTETIRVGSGPVGIAAGQGAVWVATHDRALFRIDPQP